MQEDHNEALFVLFGSTSEELKSATVVRMVYPLLPLLLTAQGFSSPLLSSTGSGLLCLSVYDSFLEQI